MISKTFNRECTINICHRHHIQLLRLWDNFEQELRSQLARYCCLLPSYYPPTNPPTNPLLSHYNPTTTLLLTCSPPPHLTVWVEFTAAWGSRLCSVNPERRNLCCFYICTCTTWESLYLFYVLGQCAWWWCSSTGKAGSANVDSLFTFKFHLPPARPAACWIQLGNLEKKNEK